MTSSPPISCHYFLSALLFWENKLEEEKKNRREQNWENKNKKKLLVSHSTPSRDNNFIFLFGSDKIKTGNTGNVPLCWP